MLENKRKNWLEKNLPKRELLPPDVKLFLARSLKDEVAKLQATRNTSKFSVGCSQLAKPIKKNKSFMQTQFNTFFTLSTVIPSTV